MRSSIHGDHETWVEGRHFPVSDLAFLAATDGAVCFLAAAGVAAPLVRPRRRRVRVGADDVPALVLASLGAGIFLLPVVWTEYFVLVVNFAVVVAGLFLFDLAAAFRADARPDRARRVVRAAGWR